MNQKLKSTLFLTKYSMLKLHSRSYFHELLHNQYLSSDELEMLNWRKTRQLLDYAYEYVPYYNKRFNEHGIHPRDIKEPDDYAYVPVLKREDLQGHFESILSTKATRRDVRLSTTGGSTGQPVKVYHQKNVVRAAAGWRMQSWWGFEPGTDFASIYRDTRTDWKAKLAIDALWWPTRRIMLNAADLSDAEIGRFINEYCRYQPPLLHGYVNALNYVASWIEERGIELPPTKAIWATSAPLTSVQKDNIERNFRAPVYDQYGCCEIYWLAAQCPAQDGLHMFTDIRRLEILDTDLKPLPPDSSGQIAVTDLENMYFPLIRYLNGDLGRIRKKPCDCSVTLPVMDKVLGRTSDNLVMPDGSQIAGEFMTTIFDDMPDLVKQFRVVQERDYSIRVQVVPNKCHINGLQLIEDKRSVIEKSLGGKVTVAMEIVDQIELRRGKLKFIESKIHK